MSVIVFISFARNYDLVYSCVLWDEKLTETVVKRANVNRYLFTVCSVYLS